MDLSRVIPQSWPIVLGGTTYLVPPMRLRDIAQLQAWLAVACPCPLEAARTELAETEGEPRRAKLAALFEQCEAWPIRYGSTEGSKLLSTRAGLIQWLSAALSRAVPMPSPHQVELLANSLEADDWRRLTAIAFDLDPLDELARMLDQVEPDPNPVDSESPDINWAQAFAEVVESTGWTFDQVADLTLAQWLAVRTGGKHEGGAMPLRSGETPGESSARRQRLFYGTDGPQASKADLRRQADAEALFAKYAPRMEATS